jgi:hypothetical protein
MLNTINIGYRQVFCEDNHGVYKGFNFFYERDKNLFRNQKNDIQNLNIEKIEELIGLKLPVHTTDYPSTIEKLNKAGYFFHWEEQYLPALPELDYNIRSIEYFIKNNETFFIPVFLEGEKLFETDPVPQIPSDILEYIKLGKASFLFLFPMEGYVGANDRIFEWFHKFSKANQLDSSSIILVHSNLILNETYKKFLSNKDYLPKITVLSYNYFEHVLWFVDHRHKHLPGYREVHENKKLENLTERSELKFTKHFSIFNRRLDVHRMITFAQIKTNENLDKTTIGSLFNPSPDHNPKDYQAYLNNDYWKVLDNYENIFKFIKTTDLSVPFTIRDGEQNGNTENLAHALDYNTHNKALISIVTETLHSDKCVFFSEKTFKPIYSLNPFIIVAGPGYLKHLKLLGYKTFDRWWDESYDEEENWLIRFNKLYKLYNDISLWSVDRLNTVYTEMLPTLEHNFNTLMDDTYLYAYKEQLLTLYNNLKK